MLKDMDKTKLISGRKVAKEIISELTKKVSLIPEGISRPKLAVIIVGEDFASKVYIRNKINFCKKIGFLSEVINLPENSMFEKVLEKLNHLNNDDNVHGILLQVPLPKHLLSKQEELLQKIIPSKDVDCFNFSNFGKVVKSIVPIVYPCTPKGIITLLNKYDIKIKEQNIVVIGASNIVGKPVAIMLEHLGATVTICNIHTKNLKFYTLNADIIISATGVKDIVNIEMIKKGSVIIDAGIIRNSDNKIRGDVDYKALIDKCSYITPVPGGVGPMTLATLMENLWCLYQQKISSIKT